MEHGETTVRVVRPEDGELLPEIGTRYGVEVDFERTMPLVERLGLSF